MTWSRRFELPIALPDRHRHSPIADFRLSPDKQVDSTLIGIALSSPKGDVRAPKAVCDA
jgi:hypothetical protein